MTEASQCTGVFGLKKGSSNPFLSKINSADGYAIYEASNALYF